MSGLAERQSVTNTRSMPPPCSDWTTLWPGAKSAIRARCSANGEQTSAGVPPSPQEKSRSAMVRSSK